MFGRIKEYYYYIKLHSLWKELPKRKNEAKYWKEVVETLFKIPEAREQMEKLKGYKTYAVAFAIAAATIAKHLGYIDEATYQLLVSLLGASGAAAIAAKVNRLQYTVDDATQPKVITGQNLMDLKQAAQSKVPYKK